MTTNSEMVDPVRDAVIDAALDLAAEKGWHGVSMADVAVRAGIGLADLHRSLRSKDDLLRAVFQRLDEAVWTAEVPQTDETPRDRLFDVAMRRFDAMQPHRAGILAIMKAMPSDPRHLLQGVLHLPRVAASMLEVAGISASGPVGLLKVKGLLLIYLAVLRVWLSDDTPDMAKTMAALDRYLKRAESLIGLAPAALRSTRFNSEPEPGSGGETNGVDDKNG
jgi:AcrR family transcriptional regulator